MEIPFVGILVSYHQFPVPILGHGIDADLDSILEFKKRFQCFQEVIRLEEFHPSNPFLEAHYFAVSQPESTHIEIFDRIGE